MDFDGWVTVRTGCTDADVRCSADAQTYAKTARTPLAARELADERVRLDWLLERGVPAARVLDWIDGVRPTLVTSTVPGVAMSAITDPATARSAAAGLTDALALLHGLDPDTCPFDRRLAVTVPAARSNVAAGPVDADDVDDGRAGRRAVRLLDELDSLVDEMVRREATDLVVCHGDACLPNVIVDAETGALRGFVDVGRLGVADRHWDLALAARSMGDARNPGYGDGAVRTMLDDPRWADRVDSERLDFYRLLDEFF